MHLPAALSLAVPRWRVSEAVGQAGQLLHVDVSPGAAARWVLSVRVSLPDAPALPPSLDTRHVLLSGAVGGAPAPLGVERVRWADYPWGIEVVVAPTGGYRTDHGEFVLALDLRDLLPPGRNTATFRLDAGTPNGRPAAPALAIDYLAKDYPGFRAAMMEHMALLCRDWTDRHPADIGVTVIEALAYAADYASQHQDATAAEAYLATATRRSSVRRHTRLLGYSMDDGHAGRTWVHVRVRRACALAAGTGFVGASRLQGVVEADDLALAQAIDQGAPVYEAMAEARLDPALNELSLYDFQGRGQLLPQGACHAIFLVRDEARGYLLAAGQRPWNSPGAVLSFWSRQGGRDGAAHPVRVIGARDITVRVDPDARMRGLSVVDVEWAAEDALPQPLRIGGMAADPGALAPQISCLGNLVLAESGRTIEDALPPVRHGEPYRPFLPRPFVVRAARLPAAAAEPVGAAELLRPSELAPVFSVHVLEDLGNGHAGAGWQAVADLLACLPDERAVVVELLQDGRAQLRFGDGLYGRQPSADRAYRARYRIGNPSHAPLKTGAITALYVPGSRAVLALRQAVAHIVNVTHSAGQRAPEPLEQARARAPRAAYVPASCATLDEMVARAQRLPGIAEAAALLETHGHACRIRVAVRATTQLWTRATLVDAVQRDLARRCLAGRTVSVSGAVLVPLEIDLVVRLLPGASEGATRDALVNHFSADGRGFFAPASIRFGQTVFASAVVAAALATQGVASASLRRFTRTDGAMSQPEVPAALLLDWNEIPLVGGGRTRTPGAGWIRFLIEPSA